jgi:hypothetical protein
MFSFFSMKEQIDGSLLAMVLLSTTFQLQESLTQQSEQMMI